MAGASSTRAPTFWRGRSSAKRGVLIATAATAILALVLPAADRAARVPPLLLNTTASALIGLYRIVPGQPGCGDLAVVRLPDRVRRLAEGRRYLPRRAFLIKPVAALEGNVACRIGGTVFVNGRALAVAHRTDGLGRALPVWRGCRRLAADARLVLAGAVGSFDSRYFGPVDVASVIGTAVPVWTLEAGTPSGPTSRHCRPHSTAAAPRP